MSLVNKRRNENENENEIKSATADQEGNSGQGIMSEVV